MANDTDLPFYAVLAQNPDRARRFGGAMSFFTTGDGYSLRHLTEGYPWDSVKSGTVIDLGGSHGDAAFALAKKYPDLKVIVQELPEVVANSKEEEALNVKFMIHDLFQPQPIKDADVNLFRWTCTTGRISTAYRYFVFKGVKQPEGSRLAILETVWDA